MKKINILLLLSFLFSLKVNAQYYATALGQNGAVLKTSLHNIIKNHTDIGWPLWSAFYSTDTRNGNEIWDIYSDIPFGTPAYTFTVGTNQCGSYSQEGSCYNHEHTWPSTYFNDVQPSRTDLFHVMPTDGWVNNKRSNFPYGHVNNATYTSTNGSKLGVTNSYTNFSSSNSNHYGFEPIDEYKGDIARNYFYMSTRYESEDGAWGNWEMANGAQLTQAAITLLLYWHNLDPVSQKEIDRNNAIYAIQGNRNPFIDYPAFAECIWGTGNCISLSAANVPTSNQININPNPATDMISISLQANQAISNVALFDMTGRKLTIAADAKHQIDISKLQSGIYILQVKTEDAIYKKQFIKN